MKNHLRMLGREVAHGVFARNRAIGAMTSSRVTVELRYGPPQQDHEAREHSSQTGVGDGKSFRSLRQHL